MIDAEEDSNIPMPDGTTHLHLADENAHISCVEILLNSSANINAVLKFSRITPIYIAILKDHTECINLLLLHSQTNLDDSMEPDDAKRLYTASMNVDIKVIKYLLNANVNINEPIK